MWGCTIVSSFQEISHALCQCCGEWRYCVKFFFPECCFWFTNCIGASAAATSLIALLPLVTLYSGSTKPKRFVATFVLILHGCQTTRAGELISTCFCNHFASRQGWDPFERGMKWNEWSVLFFFSFFTSSFSACVCQFVCFEFIFWSPNLIHVWIYVLTCPGGDHTK